MVRLSPCPSGTSRTFQVSLTVCSLSLSCLIRGMTWTSDWVCFTTRATPFAFPGFRGCILCLSSHIPRTHLVGHWRVWLQLLSFLCFRRSMLLLLFWTSQMPRRNMYLPLSCIRHLCIRTLLIRAPFRILLVRAPFLVGFLSSLHYLQMPPVLCLVLTLSLLPLSLYRGTLKTGSFSGQSWRNIGGSLQIRILLTGGSFSDRRAMRCARRAGTASLVRLVLLVSLGLGSPSTATQCTRMHSSTVLC